ncbi:hypothetical protein NAPIS_ORF01330 [Vairimorpha apis BRL 01]|uniref:Uncharacterized protein n=1 Tax=Vairimorpha apis BRL 01 TaxID=1037528 RepID=T0MD17_9MICR|nr:hypothetical protein NAPIS_ORF01330 [Vairimorpha apis BRL 01]
MILIIFLKLFICKSSYKLNLINKNLKNLNFKYKYISNIQYAIEKEKSFYLPLNIPEQINALINIDKFVISNKSSEFEISPLNYFKAENKNKEKYFGKFDKMKIKNDCVICWYNGQDLIDPLRKFRFKVFYLPSSNELEIKKYFEEDPSTFAFYVKGNFLCSLKECYIFNYHIDVEVK